MNFDEKFDKIIKQKVSEAEFPFDENNWQKASRMIDAERGVAGGAKTSKLFLLFGSLFLGVATIAFFAITMSNDTSEKSEIAQNQNTESVSSRGNQSDMALNNTEADNANTNKNAEAKTENKNSSDANTSSQNNSNVVDNSNIYFNASTFETIKRPSKTENNNSAPSENIVAANSKSETTKATEPIAEKTNETAQPKNTESKEAVVGEKSNHSTKQLPVLAGKVKYHYASGKSKTTKATVATNQNILNAAEVTSLANEGYDYLEMHSSILQIWKKDEQIKTPAQDFIRIYDEDYYKKKKSKTHYLNVEAGASYLFGWQTKNGNDAEGFNVFGGFNYGLYLSKKLSLSAGAQFYNISNIENPFYSRAAYTYGFGVNGNHTNITSKSLYYVSFPVKVYHNIFKSSKIGLGVNTGILVGAKNTVETYTESDLVKTNIVTSSNTGVYEGVNKTNIMLSALYNYRLNQRVSLNGELIYGLSDTYKAVATQNNSKENNMGVRLSVQITLFDK